MNIIYLTPNLFQTEQVNELAAALVEFQKRFDAVSMKKDAQNPHLRNSYLSLDHLINTVRPLLVECGLTVSQDLAGEHLTTVIYHTSGQFKGSAMPFSPMSGNKGTNALQELGGGITYAKRYSLAAALNISVDTDDDAQSSKIGKEQLKAQKKKVETAEQLQSLAEWIKSGKGTYASALLAYDLTEQQITQLEKLIK